MAPAYAPDAVRPDPCSNLPSRPPPGNGDHLIAHQALGLEIGPETNRHGSGSLDPFDLELTVSSISSVIDLAGGNDCPGHADPHDRLAA